MALANQTRLSMKMKNEQVNGENNIFKYFKMAEILIGDGTKQ